MNAFATIDLFSLDTVTGGNDNNTTRSGNIGVTVPTQAGPVQVGVQGSQSQSTTNYAECIGAVRTAGGSPADMRANCGLPGGGQ